MAGHTAVGLVWNEASNPPSSSGEEGVISIAITVFAPCRLANGKIGGRGTVISVKIEGYVW